MQTIADRIINRRMELGYSQEDLAKKCGWKNRSSITQIEKSENNISLKKMQKIADALGVSTAYLMGWEEKAVGEVTTPIFNENGDVVGSIKIPNTQGTKTVEEELDEMLESFAMQDEDDLELIDADGSYYNPSFSLDDEPLSLKAKQQMKKNHKEHLIDTIEDMVKNLEYVELERLSAFIEYQKTIKRNQ